MNNYLLNEYCRLEFGRVDWELHYENGNLIITMYGKPRPDPETETKENKDDN